MLSEITLHCDSVAGADPQGKTARLRSNTGRPQSACGRLVRAAAEASDRHDDLVSNCFRSVMSN
jgi:hypothetical protein